VAHRKPSRPNKGAGEIRPSIIGRNPVIEVLKHNPKRILRIFSAHKHSGGGDSRWREILALAERHKIELIELEFDKLTQACQSDSHQGFAAELNQSQNKGLSQLLEELGQKDSAVVLLLDSIFDPQNFGAILRAAECFAVDAVIYSKNRGTSLTPAVSKASAGASGLVELISVSNLADALSKLKDSGFWIAATSGEKEAQELDSFDFPKKLVILMGSEGEGLQPLLLKNADFVLRIPLYGKLESLNVSQATAILLYAFRQSA